MMATMEPAPGIAPADRHLEVATSESVAFQRTLAGLGSRGIAFALDLMLLGLVLAAEFAVTLLVVASLSAAGRIGAAALPWVAGGLVVLAFVTFWGYFISLETLLAGQTPGKRRAGIRVVRDDGSRIGVLDAVIRNVVLIADFLPGTFAVGVASILVTPKAQRLGDLAAGTIVVAEDRESVVPPEADPRVRLAREFLARSDELTPAARAHVAAEVLAAYGETAAGLDEAEMTARIGRLADLRD